MEGSVRTTHTVHTMLRGAIRCFEESGKRCCPSASSQAPMLAGVGMVCIGAAMPSGAGGGCQGMSGSDKPAYLIGQGVGNAL